MRLTCRANTGDKLSDKYVESAYSRATRFDLTVDREYVGYGICLWLGILVYLIVGEGGQPSWYPAELFQVSQSSIPDCWHYGFFSERADVKAILGYSELVNDYDHFDQLSGLEQSALEIFFKRKQEIDAADAAKRTMP
jgi:hypothetical protein